MSDIPADWYINRTVALSAELSEAHKGMATMAAALHHTQAELAKVRADLHRVTVATTDNTEPSPGQA